MARASVHPPLPGRGCTVEFGEATSTIDEIVDIIAVPTKLKNVNLYK